MLQAALALFLSNGYGAITLQRVGEAVGIRSTSVLWYFPGGKAALYAGVLMEAERQLSDALATVRATGGSLEKRVEGIARAILTAVPGHPLRLWIEARDVVTEVEYRRSVDSYTEKVVEVAAAILAESGTLQADLQPTEAAKVIIGACVAYAQGSPTANLPPEEASRLIARVITPGIRQRGARAGGSAGRSKETH